jgi:hypothetical protein
VDAAALPLGDDGAPHQGQLELKTPRTAARHATRHRDAAFRIVSEIHASVAASVREGDMALRRLFAAILCTASLLGCAMGQPGHVAPAIALVSYKDIDYGGTTDYKACEIKGVFRNNGMFGTSDIAEVAHFMDSNDNTLGSGIVQIAGALPGKTAPVTIMTSGLACKDFASIIIAGTRYRLPPQP